MAKPKVVKQTPAKPKKIVDIALPDDTLPSETSKPVIISNRPLMRDPMMAAPKEAESPSPEPVKLPEPVETVTAAVMKHERRLVPPSEAKAEQAAESVKAAEVNPEAQAEPIPQEAPKAVEPAKPVSRMITLGIIKPQSETPEEQEPEKPATAKKPDIRPLAQPESKQEASKPYSVTEGPSKKEEPLSPEAQEAKEAEEEEERRKHLDKLIEDGTYFLPVDAVSHKKAMRNSLIGLAVVLIFGAVWLVAALDAGLIQIEGVDAPTDFFAN